MKQINSNEAIKRMDSSLKESFSKIKTELENHLDSINENTHEINANFDHILKIEEKLDKLAERVDELHMIFSSLTGDAKKIDTAKYENINLTLREQEVFLVLYTAEKELNHFDIAKKLGLTVELVEKYLDSMSKKGVPIIKKYDNEKLLFFIDEEFRNIQAKRNLLDINEKISQTL